MMLLCIRKLCWLIDDWEFLYVDRKAKRSGENTHYMFIVSKESANIIWWKTRLVPHRCISQFWINTVSSSTVAIFQVMGIWFLWVCVCERTKPYSPTWTILFKVERQNAFSTIMLVGFSVCLKYKYYVLGLSSAKHYSERIVYLSFPCVAIVHTR